MSAIHAKVILISGIASGMGVSTAGVGRQGRSCRPRPYSLIALRNIARLVKGVERLSVTHSMLPLANRFLRALEELKNACIGLDGMDGWVGVSKSH